MLCSMAELLSDVGILSSSRLTIHRFNFKLEHTDLCSQLRFILIYPISRTFIYISTTHSTDSGPGLLGGLKWTLHPTTKRVRVCSQASRISSYDLSCNHYNLDIVRCSAMAITVCYVLEISAPLGRHSTSVWEAMMNLEESLQVDAQKPSHCIPMGRSISTWTYR